MFSPDPEVEYLDAFLALASRDSVVRVGDGCRIWQARPEREFVLLAADHRDASVRDRGAARIGSTLSWPQGAWLSHALASGAVLNPPLLEEEARTDLGLDPEEPIADVLVVPVPTLNCVIVATRDRLNGNYRDDDRLRLQGIAAGAAAHARSAVEPARADRQDGIDYLDAAEIAIWAVDPRGITTYINRAAAELVGLPASLIEGVPISEFVSPPRTFGGQEPRETDLPLLRADGSLRWICIRSSALDEGGSAIHTIYDITERHRRSVDLRVRLSVERSIAQLASFFLEDPEPQAIAQRTVDVIAEEFGAAAVPLAAISRDIRVGRLIATAGTGFGDPGSWQGREAPVPEQSRVALESEDALVIGDFDQRRAPSSKLADAAGARCGLVVPIAGNRGSMAILSDDPDGIHDLEREMLERVADLLSSRWDRMLPEA